MGLQRAEGQEEDDGVTTLACGPAASEGEKGGVVKIGRELGHAKGKEGAGPKDSARRLEGI